jgi:NTP pyrophosphatase (non-canonical NTP hydrolase)
MINNFEIYQELALRTEIKDYSEISRRLKQDNNVRLLHGMYLWLEIYELEQAIENADKINIIEEVGDCAWYFSLLADHFQLIEKIKINFNYDANKCINNYDLTIIKQKVFLLNDNFKKLIYYNKNLDIKKSFIDILQDLYNEFVNQFGDIWELALTKNIEKLKKRYAEEYTDKKANNRDLQAELQVFKK